MKNINIRWFSLPALIGGLLFLTTLHILESDVNAQSEFQPTGDLVMDEGTALTRRGRLNFTGAGVTCADNSGSTRTDCTIPGGGATQIVSGVVSPSSVTDDFAIGGTTSASPFYFDASSGVMTINTVGGGISVAPSLTTGSSLVLDEALEDSADYNSAAGTGTPNTFTLKVNDAGLASNLICTINSDGTWTGDCPSGGGASAVNDLSDVTITSAAADQMLIYDSGTSKWVNKSQAGPVESLLVQVDMENASADYYPTLQKFHRGVTTGITNNGTAATNSIVVGPGYYRFSISMVGAGTCIMEIYINTNTLGATIDNALTSSRDSSAEFIYPVGSGDTATISFYSENCSVTSNTNYHLYTLVERF